MPRLLTLAAALGLLLGCLPALQNDPTKFYLLRLDSHSAPHGGGAKVSIGVGPIDLPPYLDRPQIVTQTAGNELSISEFNRWVEPLQDNFTRVLANDLGLLLDTDQVFVFPWGASISPEYQVKVDVTSFIGELGGESSLVARWSIISDGGTKVLLTRRSQLRAMSSNASYDALVTALNETVTKLSREIAGAVRSLQTK